MKIAESKEGNQILLNDNGTPKNCPFQPVQFLPGKIAGQIVEHHKPCGNWCPFFEFTQKENKNLLKITCTGPTRLHQPELITNKTTLQKL